MTTSRFVSLGVAIVFASALFAPTPTSEPIVNDNVIMHRASVASRASIAPVAPAKEVSRAGEVLRVESFEITAYSPTVAECDASPLVTASGKRVYVGGIAADLRVLPFGSQVIIPGYNNGQPCTVIDTGGAIKGHKLDVFFWDAHEAVHWGRRKNVQVQILRVGK
jgi:3D (Asp-Asp-Asp) domain-containing protein